MEGDSRRRRRTAPAGKRRPRRAQDAARRKHGGAAKGDRCTAGKAKQGSPSCALDFDGGEQPSPIPTHADEQGLPLRWSRHRHAPPRSATQADGAALAGSRHLPWPHKAGHISRRHPEYAKRLVRICEEYRNHLEREQAKLLRQLQRQREHQARMEEAEAAAAAKIEAERQLAEEAAAGADVAPPPREPLPIATVTIKSASESDNDGGRFNEELEAEARPYGLSAAPMAAAAAMAKPVQPPPPPAEHPVGERARAPRPVKAPITVPQPRILPDESPTVASGAEADVEGDDPTAADELTLGYEPEASDD